MSPSDSLEEADISDRNLTILKARIKYPTASLRELQETLEEEYEISLSHNQINNILRKLRSKGLYRIEAKPDINLFEHYFFKISFHHPIFEERWQEVYRDALRNSHIVLFLDADDYYQWQFLAQFHDTSGAKQWEEDFRTRHGDIIAQLDKIHLDDIHKFDVEAAIFDEYLRTLDCEERYLED